MPITIKDGGVYLDGRRIDPPNPDPLHDITVLPPALGQTVVPDVQQAVAVLNAGTRFYFPADEAIRNNRDNQRNMLRSLAIWEPLQARYLATCQLPAHVEPQDKKDKYQVAVAKELQDIIESTPFLTKWKMALLEAIWIGAAAVQNIYYWDWSKGFKRLMVKEWIPINGDSLVWKQDSDRVAIRVGVMGGMPGTKTVSTEPADVSRAHVLSEDERNSYVIHKHIISAGDYFDPLQMGQVRQGWGIRSQVYWTWYLMHECLGILTEYLERQGTGFTIFYFEKGNPQSLAAVQQIAQAQSFQNVIIWPRMPGEEHDDSGIERIEPGLGAVQNFIKLLDEYWGGQLRRLIQGQDATSHNVSSGMNSGLSQTHENTFARFINFDSINLSETITREYLNVVQRYTFPEVDFPCKYVIDAEKPDPEKYLSAMEKFIACGGTVIEDQARSVLGFSRPDPDDDVLGERPQNPMGEVEMPFVDPLGVPQDEVGKLKVKP